MFHSIVCLLNLYNNVHIFYRRQAILVGPEWDRSSKAHQRVAFFFIFIQNVFIGTVPTLLDSGVFSAASF